MERRQEDEANHTSTISRLLRQQFAVVETYCNAATRLANVAGPNNDDSWITATRAFQQAIRRVHRHVAEMEAAVMSLRRSVETSEEDDDDHDLKALEVAVKEHYERLRRILTSIFIHNASFHGLNGFVPSPTRDSDVDVRLVALATLRASIQKTQKLLE